MVVIELGFPSLRSRHIGLAPVSAMALAIVTMRIHSS
jgi:hypothetical protein